MVFLSCLLLDSICKSRRAQNRTAHSWEGKGKLPDSILGVRRKCESIRECMVCILCHPSCRHPLQSYIYDAKQTSTSIKTGEDLYKIEQVNNPSLIAETGNVE